MFLFFTLFCTGVVHIKGNILDSFRGGFIGAVRVPIKQDIVNWSLDLTFRRRKVFDLQVKVKQTDTVHYLLFPWHYLKVRLAKNKTKHPLCNQFMSWYCPKNM